MSSACSRPDLPPGVPLSSHPTPAVREGGGAPQSSGGGLGLFNQVSAADAEAALRACCGSQRWARRVAAHRPYPTVEALLAAADEAAYDLTSGDLAEALAGESPALPHRGNLAAHIALHAAHAAYQAKFGHPFVIALEEDDPAARLDQTLAGLRTRLGHDVEEESAVTAEQLRRICRIRLLRLAEARPPRRSLDRAGSITPGLPHGTGPGSRRYDGRGRWTVPGRA